MSTHFHPRVAARTWSALLATVVALLIGLPFAAGHASAGVGNAYTLTASADRLGGAYVNWDPGITSVLIMICPSGWTETQCNLSGTMLPTGSYGYYMYAGVGVFNGNHLNGNTNLMYAASAPVDITVANYNANMPTGEYQFRVINTTNGATSNLATVTLAMGAPLALTTTGAGDLNWHEDLNSVDVVVCADSETVAADCETNWLFHYTLNTTDPFQSMVINSATAVQDRSWNYTTLEEISYGFVVYGSLNGAGVPLSTLVHSTVGPAPTADAPTALVSTPGDRSATVDYTPGADNGSPILGYEYTIDGGRTTTKFDVGITGIAVTGLTNDVTYAFKLRALTTAGAGAWSAPVTLAPVATADPAITRVQIECVNYLDSMPYVTVMQGASLELYGDTCDQAFNWDWADWDGQSYFSGWPGQPGVGEYVGDGPFIWTVADDATIGDIDEAYAPYLANADTENGQMVGVTVVQNPAPLVELDSYAPSTATGGSITYVVDEFSSNSSVYVAFDERFVQGVDWANTNGACPEGAAVLVDGTPVDVESCGGGPDEGLNFWEFSLYDTVPVGAEVTVTFDDTLLTNPSTGGVVWAAVDQSGRTTVPVKISNLPGSIDLALDFVVGADITTGQLGVHIEGSNLQPGSEVEGVLRSTPVTIGTGTVADDGTYTGLFHLPANTPAGAHSITITGVDADGAPFSVVAWFTVDSHGKVTALSFAAPTLPATGSSSLPVTGIAVLLLLVGLHCLTFVKRYPAARV